MINSPTDRWTRPSNSLLNTARHHPSNNADNGSCSEAAKVAICARSVRDCSGCVEDRAPAADLAQGRETADRWAQVAQVAGRARAEVAGRASVADWALTQVAVLELASPERAFLEDLAGVAASDEVWSDRYS
jgi:hypothetical protein